MIGIVGFGRFGKLLTKYLSEDFEVYVFSRSNKEDEIKKHNGIPGSLEEVCKQDIVIPCVPISVFKKTLEKIRNLLKKGSLVIDVCSVKEYPVKLMREILPENIQILATHPMFGPDSAANSLKNRKIVLCKIRINNDLYEKIKSYLISKELNVIEATPKEHDQQIAETQVLTHFIGRSLIKLDSREHKIDTEGYKRLMNILGVVKNDTWQLFEDMNSYNRFSKKVRISFINALDEVDRRLQK